MLTAIGARHTYVLPDTGSKYNKAKPHLQICVTNPDNSGYILSFSVGTYVTGRDPTCMLDIGDHKRIFYPSMIYYGTPHLQLATDIIKKINAGDLEYFGVLKETVFTRVCQGVRASDFVKPACAKYVEMQWAKMGLVIPR
jgi:hypothetical protein